ncbi:hypothetical protein EW145_g475 [Phellinidium pouzarii]|uniref:Spindle pole body component n=1 Tax=Phellinidium pouzarii TaxID=167371 RepID=A0A4S4LI62_9AGAM|nr:hypothetical protein EW145_g475 [Phellinidium pouzarii]
MSRPSSVASHRTASRVSHRPVSRLSQRPSTRQSTRVAPLCQALVTQITGLYPDKDADYDVVLDLVIRRIDSITKQAGGLDMHTALIHLKRFSRKARIQSHSNLSEAFDICAEMLRVETEKRSDLDTEINAHRVPDHLQLLLLLSSPPSTSTLELADDVVERTSNTLSTSSALTWADILKEEPFEGQHWQGAYGMPPGSMAEQWEGEGSSDSSTLSPVSDSSSMDALSEVFSVFDTSASVDLSVRSITSPPPRMRTSQYSTQEERVAESLRLRNELETLQGQQYWRNSWHTDAEIERDFYLSEPSTLVSALADRLSQMLPNSPKLLHLTPSAQQSIFSDFADLATSLACLRRFSSLVLLDTEELRSAQTNPSRTVEAFAEALELQIIQFEAWIAQREEMILRAHLQRGKSTVVSLLSLKKGIRDEFSDLFVELLSILRSSFPGSAWLNRARILTHVRSSPSSFSSRLLDTFFDAIQSRQSFGDAISASVLMRIFLQTAEPVWRMLGRWLSDGIFMPEARISTSDHVSLPAEFFIESNELSLTDPNFWKDGYGLRSQTLNESISVRHSGVPAFLRALAESLLSAGKSIGLLRILDHSGSFERGDGPLSGAVWPSFEKFMSDLNVAAQPDKSFPNSVFSAEDLSLLLSDHLLPICTSAGKALHEVLCVDCNFISHLHALESLFLLRKGDVMSDFCDLLFNAIDAKKMWTDFHFLNTAFRDAADSLKSQWIDTALVRLSYKHDKDSALYRSVRIFKGLVVQYTAPFPLIYIFDDRASRIYNAIFILLLQVRRAKAALDNILVRGSTANSMRSQDELKVFYATRNKFSWFVNTFLSFLSSYILHVEVEHFHDSLQAASSLDGVIKLHREHLDSLEKLCLLHEETSTLHRALLSIFDMSIVFSDYFVAFAGDTTLNTSRISASHSRRHRSRRLRRERRNVVSYAHVSSFQGDEYETSDSDLDESLTPQELAQDSFSFAASLTGSFEEEDIFSRNEKMARDLDALVRFIRREVERLASSITGMRSFGVLAFSLQDWDL